MRCGPLVPLPWDPKLHEGLASDSLIALATMASVGISHTGL